MRQKSGEGTVAERQGYGYFTMYEWECLRRLIKGIISRRIQMFLSAMAESPGSAPPGLIW
jgi:hypothetical protein